MITFDLACDQGHRFEGWFRNRRDFDAQLSDGLVSCPLCGSRKVEKQLSAVSVHVGRRTAPAQPPPAPAEGDSAAGGSEEVAPSVPAVLPAGSPVVPRAQPFFQAMTRFIETHFEDVGSRFADEARKVDSGEADARNIRGTTTPEEEAELREDGIEFLKVAIPKYDA